MGFIKGAALKLNQVNATDTFAPMGYVAELGFICHIHPQETVKANPAQLEMLNRYPISKQVLRVLDVNKYNKKIKKYTGSYDKTLAGQ
jgi:hypothetical protein